MLTKRGALLVLRIRFFNRFKPGLVRQIVSLVRWTGRQICPQRTVVPTGKHFALQHRSYDVDESLLVVRFGQGVCRLPRRWQTIGINPFPTFCFQGNMLCGLSPLVK